MKKFILILATVLISGNVFAEWTRIGGDDNYDLYVDVDAFRRNGSRIKLWTMHDFKTSQSVGKQKYQSNKAQWELDCKEEQFRMPAALGFTGKKGAGQTVFSDYDSNDTWQPVIPDTMGQAVLNVGCYTPDHRKWILLQTTSEGNSDLSVYYDLSRVERSESRVTMPALLNVRGKDYTGLKNYSVEFLREYDCAELQTREVSRMIFTANMGLGKSHSSTGPMPWKPVPPENTGDNFWVLACLAAVPN